MDKAWISYCVCFCNKPRQLKHLVASGVIGFSFLWLFFRLSGLKNSNAVTKWRDEGCWLEGAVPCAQGHKFNPHSGRRLHQEARRESRSPEVTSASVTRCNLSFSIFFHPSSSDEMKCALRFTVYQSLWLIDNNDSLHSLQCGSAGA